LKKNRLQLFIGAISLVAVTALLTFTASLLWFTNTSLGRQDYYIAFDRNEVKAENVEKFRKVKTILENYYYEDVDGNILLEGAIDGMARALGDPYTVYLPRDEMKLFTERTSGSYVGIGVTVNTGNDGILTVVECYENSPAEAAGIKAGDKIVRVDGKDVTTIKDSDLIISMIKGEENTIVNITVFRPSEGRQITMEVVRKKINIINVSSKILDGGIGYLRIKMFDQNVSQYFGEHLDRLLKSGIRALIIDVRDNPGGSYDQVVKIIDRIVPEGIIVYTEDRAGKRTVEKSDSRELNIPLAVLINENSASASEILAGAIKDHGKGILVGNKTFGKGLVQIVITLDDGSGIKLTTSRYFTPSGVCIQGIGIEPDIEEKLDEKYKYYPVSQIPEEDDTQLLRAIQVLNKSLPEA